MSRRRFVLGLPAALLLAGCGSTHSSSAPAPTGTATAPITVSTQTATNAPTTSTTYPAPPPANTTTTHTNPTKHSPPPPSGARIPATFTIAADGTLTPPTISAPVGFTVQVTIVDHGPKQAKVIIRTPKPLDIVAPPGGSAFLDASRLPKGTYAIDVNGTPRGSLVIGASPGP